MDSIEYFLNHCTLLSISLTLICIIVVRWAWKQRQLPPGPWGIPIVGYLPFIGKYPEVQLAELSKRYGNVMSISVGSQLAVILGDYSAIKEAFIKEGDIFSGRPKNIIFKFHEEDRGISVEDGEQWHQQRRFALRALRDFGMGKLSLEPKIQEEINCLLNEIAKFNGRPVDLERILGISVSNMISVLELGQRFDYANETFRELRHKLVNSVRVIASFPFIRSIHFFDRFTTNAKARQDRQDFHEFIRKLVKQHEKHYNEGSQKDYIDAYLTHKRKLIKKNGNPGCFNDKWLEANIVNLFGAGSETTTTVIRWFLLYMMAYPTIQSRVQKEIDDVIGMNRFPSITDRPLMPFTEATLMEVQRCSSIVPLNIVRSNLEDVYLLGNRIPKRSLILANLWGVHHDPKLWTEPHVFNPERFIDEKGQLMKSEYLIPFSIGKRACAGEGLAKMEIFLYFTLMLQRFIFLPPEGTKVTLAYDVGVVRAPLPFEVCAIPRENYDIN